MPRNSHSARGRARQDKGGRLAGGRWRPWLLALLLVAALIVAVFHFGDFKKFAQLVQQARPTWLVGALALQVSTYVLLSAQWSLALKAGGSPRPLRKLLPLTISKLFADQVLPTAGVSGNVVLIDRLTAIGVPRRNAVAAAILAILAYYASYAVSAVVAVSLLAVRGKLSLLIAGVVGLLLAVALAIPCAALWLQDRGLRALPRWLAQNQTVTALLKMVGEAPHDLIRDPKLIVRLGALNLGVFLADAATLIVCLLSLNQPVAIVPAFVAFTMASIVVTLGPVPLGLGSFEAVCVGMLRLMGIPFEAALSATLLLRGFTLWLPFALGFVVTRRQLARQRR